MSSVAKPKGHLPPRIYWARRLVVLGLAFALVFGISRLLSDEDQASDPSARPAAAPAASPSSGQTPSASALPTEELTADRPKQGKKQGDKAKASKTPLAVPTGPCENTDVSVVPSVDDAFAVHDVTITLTLTTLESPACTWSVSAESVVLKITSGDDRIWTTQDCPTAIPFASVVLRKETATEVDVTWSGQRSDSECTRSTLWVEPGYYHVLAAAYGAEPADHQFQLVRAPDRTVPAESKRDREKATDREKKQTQKRERDRSRN
jgi:hypothetical protein